MECSCSRRIGIISDSCTVPAALSAIGGKISCNNSCILAKFKLKVRFALLISLLSVTRKMRPSGKPNLENGTKSLSLVQKQAWYGLKPAGNKLFTPRRAEALNTSVREAPNARTSDSGDLNMGPGGKHSPVLALMLLRYSFEDSSGGEVLPGLF